MVVFFRSVIFDILGADHFGMKCDTGNAGWVRNAPLFHWVVVLQSICASGS
jgi:hypothetical protein